MRIQGLIIDPQQDFCDATTGTLYVPGADADMQRLATFVARCGERFERLHVTLDTHHPLHIAHPLWWQDHDGNHPTPFTIITEAEVREGRWRATNPAAQARSLAYVAALERNGRYPLCIWPYHCLIGTPGHAVSPDLAHALADWEARRLTPVDYVVKGQNIWTEHYSAIAADVPDMTDVGTQPNIALMTTLHSADVVFVAGEAGSHCVANTVRDLVTFWQQTGDDTSPQKLVLLTDTMSAVPGFENYQTTFLEDMRACGVRTMVTAAFQEEIASLT